MKYKVGERAAISFQQQQRVVQRIKQERCWAAGRGRGRGRTEKLSFSAAATRIAASIGDAGDD